MFELSSFKSFKILLLSTRLKFSAWVVSNNTSKSEECTSGRKLMIIMFLHNKEKISQKGRVALEMWTRNTFLKKINGFEEKGIM